jgi:hypothetical protein
VRVGGQGVGEGGRGEGEVGGGGWNGRHSKAGKTNKI